MFREGFNGLLITLLGNKHVNQTPLWHLFLLVQPYPASIRNKAKTSKTATAIRVRRPIRFMARATGVD
ncbi:hypothetical protein CQ12_10970 [Bradyrhizobium jicamae]|uniref:Uncharacterized protein n=1 Tax=Bradyrhizobium jicamae TaxID=280332 RepID=A0A0R3MAK5_9BRAD|nr:hypothetical protein CQ12_10970 [Bradyrhizobium jicamae]